MNQIVLMGRLTRDPELRRTLSGTAVASFTLAVNRDYSGKDEERKADFIDCVAWKGTGEFISKHFTKGQLMAVVGSLQITDWIGKDRNKRHFAEVLVNRATSRKAEKAIIQLILRLLTASYRQLAAPSSQK